VGASFHALHRFRCSNKEVIYRGIKCTETKTIRQRAEAGRVKFSSKQDDRPEFVSLSFHILGRFHLIFLPVLHTEWSSN